MSFEVGQQVWVVAAFGTASRIRIVATHLRSLDPARGWKLDCYCGCGGIILAQPTDRFYRAREEAERAIALKVLGD